MSSAMLWASLPVDVLLVRELSFLECSPLKGMQMQCWCGAETTFTLHCISPRLCCQSQPPVAAAPLQAWARCSSFPHSAPPSTWMQFPQPVAREQALTLANTLPLFASSQNWPIHGSRRPWPEVPVWPEEPPAWKGRSSCWSHPPHRGSPGPGRSLLLRWSHHWILLEEENNKNPLRSAFFCLHCK